MVSMFRSPTQSTHNTSAKKKKTILGVHGGLAVAPKLGLLVVALLLAGCSGGAVVFAPTPLPTDSAPTRYAHPSGAFSVLLPRNWAVYAQNLTTLASASFSPPGSAEPLVSITVVNTGEAITPDGLGELMFQYQTQLRPDLERYTEEARQAMGDGSWRITGLRTSATGETQQINTFIQRGGALFAVMEILVPSNAARQSELQTIINTLALGSAPDLPPAPLAAITNSAAVNLQIVNVHTWTTPDGVLFVTGEVANRGNDPFSQIPVRAVLTDDSGNGIIEAVDSVLGYTLLPGGFAPFSLRFGQGQPADATNYTVTLGSPAWVPIAPLAVAPPDALTWTDETQFSQDQQLFVVGSISNTSDEAVRAPRAVVTVFDEAGRVIAAGFADAEDEMLPVGAETGYTILVPDLGGTPANYLVNVQALPCAENCE